MTSLPADRAPDAASGAPGPAPADPLDCARCGAPSGGTPPLTWTCSVEGGVRRYFCEPCARASLRAIEGRLDSAWW